MAVMCCHFLVSCPATSLLGRAPLLVCSRALSFNVSTPTYVACRKRNLCCTEDHFLVSL